MSQTVSFRLPTDEHTELNDTADEKAISLSELARRRYRAGRDGEDVRATLERLERRVEDVERRRWWRHLFVVALVVLIVGETSRFLRSST